MYKVEVMKPKRIEAIVITSGSVSADPCLAVSAPTYYASKQDVAAAAASILRAGTGTGPTTVRAPHAIKIDLHG
jgi:hypothetical protein